MMGSYPREINAQNALEYCKDGLCYLQNESVSIKVFLLNMHEVRILFDLEKPTRHLIYYAY